MPTGELHKMLTNLQKIKYLFSSLKNVATPVVCPSCDGREARLIDRKYVATRLFECLDCNLYFRHPRESATRSRGFYQESYVEGDGITTSMPPQTELEELKELGFSIGNRNAARFDRLFNCLFDGLDGVTILDFGASWGYLSYQFKSYGMDVESFEISEPRAEYGNRKLGLAIRTQEDRLRGENDIFFSSHVIEHVPSVSRMLDVGKRLLRADGYLITLCPNGNPEYRAANPEGFHRSWGKVHPNYLNGLFFQKHYQANPYFITTSPFEYEELKGWDGVSQFYGNVVDGEELLVVALPNQP